MSYTTLTLDNYDIFEKWGFFIVTKEIGTPEPKIYTVDIPGGDGVLDLTESLGSISYGMRPITVKLRAIGEQNKWTSVFSEIQEALHGRRMQITFSDDAGYYYVGRVKVKGFHYDFDVCEIQLDMECSPYKYEVNAYGANWLWDPFDFLYGVIYDNNITISGTTVVPLEVLKMPVTPTFRASTAMSLQYRGNTYGLAANTDMKFYDIVLTEGINNLTFVGNGTVQITYTNGIL